MTITPINITAPPYNAVGDGTTDNTSAINSALATGHPIYAPYGVYLTQGGHSLSADGQYVTGDGVDATTFKISGNTFGFSLGNGRTSIGLTNLTVSRTGTVTSACNGIAANQSCSKGLLEHLRVAGHYNGIVLGHTDYSLVRDVISESNTNMGILHTNTLTSLDGGHQWSLDHVLLSSNANHGYEFAVTTGVGAPPSISLGDFINVSTYNNGAMGMAFVGASSVPIEGVRIRGGFFGQDHTSGLWLDTWGSFHQITGAFVELTATNAGIVLTANNLDVLVDGCRINGCWTEGIYNVATVLNVSGCVITNNGQGAVSGRKNGIGIASGSVNVVGNMLGNVGGATSQDYGIYRAGGSNTNVGNLFVSNTVAPTFP